MPSLKKYVWASDLAEMESLSLMNCGDRFIMCDRCVIKDTWANFAR